MINCWKVHFFHYGVSMQIWFSIRDDIILIMILLPDSSLLYCIVHYFDTTPEAGNNWGERE